MELGRLIPCLKRHRFRVVMGGPGMSARWVLSAWGSSRAETTSAREPGLRANRVAGWGAFLAGLARTPDVIAATGASMGGCGPRSAVRRPSNSQPPRLRGGGSNRARHPPNPTDPSHEDGEVSRNVRSFPTTHGSPGVKTWP